MTPATIASTFAALVDVLLPGDEEFPPASLVGTHGLFAERLRQHFGAEGIVSVAERLTAAGSFVDADPDMRAAVVEKIELEDPALFALLYSIVCYSYYQHPVVTATIRALGHDYNDAPQPKGYDLPKFDFSPGVNVPLNPKGQYKWTEWLEPVDISSLAHLNLPVHAKKDT